MFETRLIRPDEIAGIAELMSDDRRENESFSDWLELNDS